MAGILEVTNKAEKEATKLWTVVPEASDAPPETRSGASVDDMLAMAAVYLGVAATAVKPIVLLPAGFGRGTVVGDDAVVLLLLAARAAEMDRRAAPAGRSVAVVPGTAGAVRWANANDKVHAQLAEGTKRGHVRVDISATRLAVKVGALVGGDFKLATLLDGALFQDVDPAASSWTLVDTDLGSAELQVTLAKKVPMRWLMLVRA
ncbi:hypothetical protein JL720_9235 [Aureococcus anophagefferens]|nr:hypothetical protein JL720_9235 [Aureococcus anophagefferens]